MSGKHSPPAEYRFPPRTSGNPKGRPRGAKNKPTKLRTPALDETTRYPVGGVLRRMSRRDAIIRLAQTRAIKLQDPKLTKVLLDAELKLAQAEAAVPPDEGVLLIKPGRSGALENLEAILPALGLGRLTFIDHPAQRVALVPELVTLALSRFKDHRLTRDEQKLVVSFTLTPWKVEWPEWWEPDLRERKCRVPARFFAKDDAEWKRALTPPPPPPPRPAALEPFLDLDAEWSKEEKWRGKRTVDP